MHDQTDFDPFAGPEIVLTVPSTEPQRELWTGARMGREASLAFNEAATIRLAGALDVAALRAAIGDLLERHEALRSTFSGDGLTMLVGDARPPALPLHDWSALPESERATRWATLMARVVEEPFDLEAGPLARFELVRLAPDAHALVISAHHIVCDGWSFGVIAGDLAALYSARCGVAPAPDAPASFVAYARAEVAGTRAAARVEDEKYWLTQFSGAPPVLDLPLDRARPALKTYRASREDRTLSPELTRRVKSSGAKAGASLFATLCAGFAVLLHRLTGQEDLVVGVPAAGQNADEALSTLVGHCVNMLPLRLRVHGALPFASLLAQTRTRALDAFDHQQLGFGSLLERLPRPRDPSRLPLVSVIFNLDRTLPPSAMPFEGLEAELETVPRQFENFELFLNAVETKGGVVLECQYNADLFDAATVRRWLESYERLLDAAARDPQQEVGALDILTDDDRAALARCNATALALPAERLVHELIEAQAARMPDAVAVEFDGATVTYAELDARANRLAHRLRAEGVRRGVLVGLCLERTPELLVGLLAVLKAGGGYVPLDPNYPADRLSYMADDASLGVLLTDARTAGELSLPARATVLVDGDAAAIAAEPATRLPDDSDAADPEGPAYVIYTSGSTGKPKGVLVPHRSVVNLLASVRETPGMRESDRVLAITTLSFDIAVSEVILPLTVGARIVLASRETSTDGLLLWRLIERAGVTFIDATPATYRLLLAAGWTGDRSLRVICTGEAMPRDLAEALVTRVGELWNGYGPTETTVWSTFHRVTAPVGKVLIGRPVANTHVHVLDPRGQQVPVGVVGELFVAGRGVTKGYLNRPDLTRERFIADPDTPNAVMYRTGDLVRLLAGGALECLGRNDSQVKVRGFRIELGEIEAVLAQHPAVRAAVVLAREDRPGDVRLVAYVVPDESEASDADLRAFVKRSLPDYMVPTTYVRLASFPLTPSGKVDSKALPAPEAGSAASSDAFEAPRTETETMLADLWAQSLGVPRVSVRDDFFALGGHSLLASQVLARLRRDHGVELPFRRIFEAPTVEQLARLIDDARGDGLAPAPQAAIVHRPGVDRAPLTVVQERIWMLEELAPEERAVHAHAAAWRLLGALDHARLEAAQRAFIQRHPMMRTSFHVVDGERVQVVSPEVVLPSRRVDLSGMARAEQDAALDRLYRDEQATPFDLAQAPLFRTVVVRLGEQEHVLYTLRHGIIWDGWSFDLYVRDLTELYAAMQENRAPTLSELPVTYGDFAAWQREWLEGPEMARQTAWWRAQLDAPPSPLEMPTDRPRPPKVAHDGANETLEFPIDQAEALRTMARKADATLFMLLFAAYVTVLHRQSGQRDLLVGSPVRARTRAETEEIIGPFVNTLLLRVKVEPGMTFAGLVRQVRDTTLDAFGQQEMPFERLAKVPVLRALFSMQDARERAVRMGDLRVEQVHVPQTSAANDLMLWTMESKDRLLAVLNYSTPLFDRATAQLFLRQLGAVLQAVLRDTDQAIDAIELEPARADESDAAPRAVAAVPAHEQVARRAAERPEAPAVRGGAERLTYGQLMEQTGRVAAALRAAGVQKGMRVGVSLPATSVGRVAAVLGVLRAGGAVMLSDADEPAARRAAALSDAGAATVVADRAIDGVRTILLADALGASSSAAPDESFDAGDVAAIVPAAGAAVPLSHAELGAMVRDVGERVGVSADDVALAVLPPDAPAALTELLLPLVRGAELVLADSEEVGDGPGLAAALRAAGATVMTAPVSAWRGLAAAGWTGGDRFRAITVGAPMPAAAVPELLGRVGRAFDAYQPATAGAWAALHEITAADARAFVGEPVGGASVRIDDATGALAATNIAGALRVQYAGGASVNGDRARRRSDGRMQLVATDPAYAWVDATPVDLGAVEASIRAQPGVADAAVAMHADAAGVSRLVAYVVPQAGAEYSDAALRRALRAALPARAVPRVYVPLDALPGQAGGGISRQLLVSPFEAARAAAVTPPRTDAERLLADAWAEALEVERVGVHDNFFDLGGTSLLCFRVVESVYRKVGARLSPRTLLVGTLEQAAAQLSVARGGVAAPAADTEPRSAQGGVLGRLKSLLTGGA